jgi:anti-sigma B factor antagonist
MAPVEKWSDQVTVVHLADDPQFTEELESFEKTEAADKDMVLDFAAVHFINSSNLARVLRLRTKLTENNRRLVLCNVKTQVWSTMLMTGLDKLFDFADSVSSALTSLQLGH